MTPRKIAQIALAVIAIAAAGGAVFRYLDRSGEFFGERIEALPTSGPVGMRPVMTPHGYKGTKPFNVIMCVGSTSDVGDCIKLGTSAGSAPFHAKPIPAQFPDGTDVAPGTYVIRTGPDASGQYPVRGSFKIVPFKVGPKHKLLTGFESVSPSALQVGQPKEIARGAPCAP